VREKMNLFKTLNGPFIDSVEIFDQSQNILKELNNGKVPILFFKLLHSLQNSPLVFFQ